MAEAVKLLLALDVAVVAARELDVLLAAEHLLERLRLGAGDVPHLVGEHDGVAPRIVAEHRLDRRVGKDAAVPVGLAVDAHRGKGRRQRGGRKHVAEG